MHYRKRYQNFDITTARSLARDNTINFTIEQTSGYKPLINTSRHNIAMKFRHLYEPSQANTSYGYANILRPGSKQYKEFC